MFRSKLLLCLAPFLYLGIAQAATLTVGVCKSAANPYKTISSAIAAVPANGLIDVCPGTYPEQLVITKPMTIAGLILPNKPGVTITAPATGIEPIAGSVDLFAQILVNNAGGPVNLTNLAVTGSGSLLNSIIGRVTPSAACTANLIADFAGVRYQSTPGTLTSMTLSGQVGSSSVAGSATQLNPNCGSGIEFMNDSSIDAVVEDSFITNGGVYGIYSSGKLSATRNMVTGAGPFHHGIDASLGIVSDNTVTGASEGSGRMYLNSVGIAGGESVRGNIVQTFSYGIQGATLAESNTLLNNSIGLMGNAAIGNLIDGPASYSNPNCAAGDTAPGCILPTVAIDLGCAQTNNVQSNGMVSLGIGFAHLGASEKVSTTNLLAHVATVSTACIP